MNVSHFDYSISIFIRNDKPKYLKIISVVMNCGSRSMGDTAVNYPLTLFWSSAISWDQCSQSPLIAKRKSQIILLSGLSQCVQPGPTAPSTWATRIRCALWRSQPRQVRRSSYERPAQPERTLSLTTASRYSPLWPLQNGAAWSKLESETWWNQWIEQKRITGKVNHATLNKDKERKNYNPARIPMHSKCAFLKRRWWEGSFSWRYELWRKVDLTAPTCVIWGGRKTPELEVRFSQFGHSEAGWPRVKRSTTWPSERWVPIHKMNRLA